MNYLDQKGCKEYKNCMGRGVIKVSGCSLYKLLRNLRVNYAGSTGAKDPVWKYKWAENITDINIIQNRSRAGRSSFVFCLIVK